MFFKDADGGLASRKRPHWLKQLDWISRSGNKLEFKFKTEVIVSTILFHKEGSVHGEALKFCLGCIRHVSMTIKI